MRAALGVEGEVVFFAVSGGIEPLASFLLLSGESNRLLFVSSQVLRSGSISDESDTEPPSPPRPRRGRRQAVFDSKVSHNPTQPNPTQTINSTLNPTTVLHRAAAAHRPSSTPRQTHNPDATPTSTSTSTKTSTSTQPQL